MPGYRTWATNDVITASDMNELHADPQTADVTTTESTTATSYGALTTPGPALTKTLVNGQKVVVVISARIDTPVASVTQGWMSFAVSGATTQASSDTNSIELISNGTVAIGVTLTRATVFTATASGSHTFTCQYKSSSGAASYSFRNRRIIIKPF